ncbi:MAG TPA: outer membrane beta-barrel protein [Gemmatimonadaceae bacterium]|nr:outer membrane beta-barrel protein [Gemmatimonadaceae bacterium]
MHSQNVTRGARGARIASRLGAVIVAVLSLVGAPRAAGAQGIGLGASVGANLPAGSYGDAAKAGLVLDGFLGVNLSSTFGVRGELFWSRSDIDNPVIDRLGDVTLPSGSFADVTGNVDLVGGLATAVWAFGSGVIQPYLLGGVGVYRRRVSQDVSGAIEEFRSLRESNTDFGWNAGAGLRFNIARLHLFAEGRYHSVRTDPERTTFIPVSVGVAF